MRLVSWLARAARSLLGRGRAEHDLDDEIQFHLDMAAASHRAVGRTADQAARLAATDFGSQTRIKESSREVRRLLPLEDLGRDLRLGWRNLRRAPGVSLAAATSLGLGIGASTTMYSITRGVLRDLPVAEPDRLVHVAGVDRRTGEADLRLASWDLRSVFESQRTLEGVGLVEDETFHLGDADRFAERRSGASVSPEVFRLLRVGPALGRSFDSEDARPGANPVVILSDRLWRERYEGSATVLGRPIRVNGTPRVVIGVMPPGFHFPTREDLWVPVEPAANAGPGEGPGWTVIGRLRDGVGMSVAVAELATVGSRLAAESPATHRNLGILVRPYRDQMIRRDARIIFDAMVIVVSFVLLIACANVANLLLARAISRNREMAVRGALGASRRRIVVQVLTEASLLAGLGGLLGVALAHLGVRVFNAAVGFELTYWMRIAVDPRVLVFAAVLVLGSTLFAGLAPARQATRVDLAGVLRDETRGSTVFRLGRVTRGLVGFEVALSAVLLVVTAMATEGIRRTGDPRLAVDPAIVATVDIELPEERYLTLAARARFYRTLSEGLAAHAGASAVALTTALPGLSAPRVPVEVGHPAAAGDALPQAATASIGPGFFKAFGVDPLEGRDFTWDDGEAAPPVALINRRFAETHFPGGSPIGQRVRVDSAGTGAGWATIVGVVPNVGLRVFRERQSEGVYRPISQTGSTSVAVAVLTSSDPDGWSARVQEVIRGLDADVPVFRAGTLRHRLDRARSAEQIFGFLFLAFGITALVMAVVGLASLVVFAVRQRTREIGIRLALGAAPGDVIGLVARGGLWQLGLGLGVGLVLAAAVAPLFGEALFGGDPRDWRLYLLIGLVMGGAGLIAAWVPARRALRLAPAEVLREE